MTADQPVGSSREEEPTGPVIRDKRRIDPQTGAVRGTEATKETEMTNENQTPEQSADGGQAEAEQAASKQDAPEGMDPTMQDADSAFAGGVGDDLPNEGQEQPAADEQNADEATQDVHPDTLLAQERLEDLQRLQAEYVNYKRRVDRDRELIKVNAQASFVESLMPVLDEIHFAKQAGELDEDGPFGKISGRLEAVLAKQGLVGFGAAGEAFDPNLHEALMRVEDADLPEGAEGTTIVQVMQPGYKLGERVVRPARVSVADPQ